MLFLLNDRVLDLGVAAETLLRTGGPPPHAARLMNAIAEGQAAAFAAEGFVGVHEDVLVRIAAEIALTSQANAALFVRPPRARSPAQVAVRLASAPLTTLARLQRRQELQGSDAGHINAHVWNLARAAAPA